MKRAKNIVLLLVVLIGVGCLFVKLSTHAQQTDYERQYQTLKAQAEKLYQEKSYALANAEYAKINPALLPLAESRWVQFRLADTLWRSQAATETADISQFDRAQRQLDTLVRDIQRSEDRDLVWVEVQESLGDFWWLRRQSHNWYQGWQYYQQALDWWASSPEIDVARDRYLKIVFRMSSPGWADQYYYYGYYGSLPLEVAANALAIAQTENDKAHASYLLAATYRYQGGQMDRRERVPALFEQALKPGKSTDWYDDALFAYAQWMKDTGVITWSEQTGWTQKPDFVKALELYRRLTTEFQEGETRFFDDAQEEIKTITQPVVEVSVSNIFLPESEIEYSLSWRNVKQINLAIYKTNLTQDVVFKAGEQQVDNWLETIALSAKTKVKSWTKETGEKGDYKPGSETLRLDEKLPVGAYLITAEAGGQKSRELILVTNASLVIKTSPTKVIAFLTDAANGKPLGGAQLRMWDQYYENDAWQSRDYQLETDQNGLAQISLVPHTDYNHRIFVAGKSQDHQAFCVASDENRSESAKWKVYAFTDRPAYRPNETVNWKFLVRNQSDQTYTTPANQVVEYEITDPRGTKVKADKATLNQFGSAWGTLDLTETMPLGEYRITFWTDGRTLTIGAATLFRMEEYKLPEFKVSVSAPEENGRKKTFRLGDEVEVTIQAEYYFGGPVANATVQVVVYQKPFYQYWQEPREFPWFYEESDQNSSRRSSEYGNGQTVKQETIKTDLNGKATLKFETPRDSGQDFEYRVEARVTDASRREIIGSDKIRVTRQRYYVYPRADHWIYQPQDRVMMKFKAIDANSSPVEAEGTVTIWRETWREIWVDPTGREVTGDELRKLQTAGTMFPLQVPKGEKPWKLKARGYKRDEVLKQTVKTNPEGNGELMFTATQEGYYTINWASTDQDQRPVLAATQIWVSTTANQDLGFHPQQVQIIVDKDTAQVGRTMPVLLTSPVNDRYILFTVESEEIYSHQIVHVTGTTRLVEVPIDARHVPNVKMTAVMVNEYQVVGAEVELVVPPTENFLKVDVKADREEYQARQEGTLTVTTRDSSNRPVSAEVALGLSDESVLYIQSDYAADPRAWFYGRKRLDLVKDFNSFQLKPYTKVLPPEPADESNLLIDGIDQIGYGTGSGKGMGTGSGLGPGRGGGYGGGIGFSTAGGQSISFGFGDASRTNEFRGQMVTEEKLFKRKANGEQDASKGDLAISLDARQTQEEPSVVVRNDFRATAFWQPDIRTDAQGKAVVKVTYPDTLTSWKAVARAFTTSTQTGIGEITTRTKQPLIVRLQAPRFFVEQDLATVSAVINNNTSKDLTVMPTITAEGIVVSGIVVNGQFVKGEQASIKVPANSEARADWVVSAQEKGTAKVKVTARSGQLADAMERSYPIFEHGIEKLLARSGKLRGDGVTIKLELPVERKPETTRMSVQVTPSMAVTMLDALPYLIDYPYGCTEQTMSRFLPAVITAKTLNDLGVKPESVMGKVFGGIEPETADKTHSRAPQDLRKLDDMTRKGLERLYDFQHSDGGWGWWKEGSSDHFMTAYVLWGMAEARNAGIPVKPEVMERAAEFLDKEIVEEETHYDMQAWMLHALSVYYKPKQGISPTAFHAKAFSNLWLNRERLNAYTLSLLALAAINFDHKHKASVVAQNLVNGVKLDATPDVGVLERNSNASDESVVGTAHWGSDGLYWHWSESPVETTAFALRALVAIDPNNKLVEQTMNWLVKNRRGAQWSNTRDTAITVLALNDYLKATKELGSEISYEVLVNGRSIVTKTVTPEDALSAPSRFEINPEFIRNGLNDINIVRKSGKGPLYFSAQTTFFSTEDPVTPAGNEMFVNREYFRLVARPTLLKGYVYDRIPLKDGESLTSGDRVEVVVTIETKNDYEYLLFEDLKPAGLEAVQLRSGEPLYARELRADAIQPELRGKNLLEHSLGLSKFDYTNRQQWVYQELRDRKVAMFVSKLPQGVWQIKYDLRAEVPGIFHALPLMAHAMYVPEIKSNSTEIRLTVDERKDK
ncbi:MAG: alpha-2-macroglobulin [Acidobacteria bacterium]|nr:alpha-2-macroglobulin [Acidobacteriota bacterium]